MRINTSTLTLEVTHAITLFLFEAKKFDSIRRQYFCNNLCLWFDSMWWEVLVVVLFSFLLLWIFCVLRRNFLNDAGAPTCSFLRNILLECLLFVLILLERERERERAREHGHAASRIYPPKLTEHAQGRRVLLEAYNNMDPVVLWTPKRWDVAYYSYNTATNQLHQHYVSSERPSRHQHVSEKEQWHQNSKDNIKTQASTQNCL